MSAPQPGGLRAHRFCDLLLQGSGALGALADRPAQLAGDAHPGALLGAGELASHAVEPEDPVQAAGRQLQFGPEVVQVPAQALLVFRASLDEILAVVEQEPQLQGPLVEVGAGKGLGTLSERRPGDGQRIDRVRLAPRAFPPAALAHQLRRHPDHALARGNQEPLEGTGDVAAVLDRPDPFGVEASPPGEELAKPRLPGCGRQLAGELTGARKHGAAGMGSLVGVRSDHDHWLRPFDWLSPVRTDRRRTDLTRGEATLLSSHDGDPRGAASDTTDEGQTSGSTASLRVSSPPARGTNRLGRTLPPTVGRR